MSKQYYEHPSNPIIIELAKKLKRYEVMRDNELEEKNYSKAAIFNENANGIKMSIEIVDELLSHKFWSESAENEDIGDNQQDDYPEEQPDTIENMGEAVGSLFSSNEIPERGINKMVATEPPNNRAERRAIVSQDVEAPQAFKELNNPKVKKFVKDSNDFYEAILISKSKKSSIDIESITNPRMRAVAEEQKAMDESIGMPSYIINEKYASLQLNDLGISLPLNSPIDLSRFSAKRLYDSNDLKSIINSKMIRFISPDEAAAIIESNANPNSKDEPKVFNNHREAQRAMEDDEEDDPNEIDLENNLEGASEQEQMAGLINLTPQSPKSGVRKTVHGGSIQSRPSQGQANKTSHQQHKVIKRVGE